MNAFLWETLLYFGAFLENQRAMSDENVTVPGYVLTTLTYYYHHNVYMVNLCIVKGVG